MVQFIYCNEVGTSGMRAIPVDRILDMEEIFDDVQEVWGFAYTLITITSVAGLEIAPAKQICVQERITKLLSLAK